MRRLVRGFGAAVLTCAGLGACAPVENQRGYLPDMTTVDALAVGADTKNSISQKLGNPSTSSNYGPETWYYISSHQEQALFFLPESTSRQILAIRFGDDGKVNDIKRYSLEDGHVVDFVSRETPTRGRELTLLQQIFNATPGAGPISATPNPGDEDQ